MKKKYIKQIRYPVNYNFWFFVFKNQDKIKEFLKRGNKRQKKEIIHALNYTKQKDVDFYDEIEGKKWLKKFKDKEGKRR